MHDGYPEGRHHRVSDELLDRAAVALQAPSRRLEVARHHAPEGLGVEPLAERRRARHVCEEHGHRLAHLAGDGALEPDAAVAAEAGAVLVLPTAGRARGHGRSLRGFEPRLHSHHVGFAARVSEARCGRHRASRGT